MSLARAQPLSFILTFGKNYIWSNKSRSAVCENMPTAVRRFYKKEGTRLCLVEQADKQNQLKDDGELVCEQQK